MGSFFRRHENGLSRPAIVEIESSDAIFHTVYDLDEGYQIVGAEHLKVGYKNDGNPKATASNIQPDLLRSQYGSLPAWPSYLNRNSILSSSTLIEDSDDSFHVTSQLPGGRQGYPQFPPSASVTAGTSLLHGRRLLGRAEQARRGPAT
ncbi:MAG: hypothetical protein LAP39_29755 [Acidobacteriia bacterium]|nr:hypothetical protein [Terriglobia bacterium]